MLRLTGTGRRIVGVGVDFVVVTEGPTLAMPVVGVDLGLETTPGPTFGTTFGGTLGTTFGGTLGTTVGGTPGDGGGDRLSSV